MRTVRCGSLHVGLPEQLELLGTELRGLEGLSGHVPARAREARDEPGLHRVVHDHRNDGNASRGLPGSADGGGSGGGHQDIHGSPTSSAASAGRRSGRPSAQRYSIAMVRPSS